MKRTVLLSIIIGLFSAYEIVAQTPGETFRTKNYKLTNNIGPINNGYRQMQTSPLNYKSGTLFNGEFNDFTKGEPDSSNVILVARALYGPADCVFSQDNYAYLGAGGALLIFDCSDPDTSILVGSIYLGMRSVGGMVKYIYVKDNYVYIANDYEGLWIIDVSDYTNPCKVSEVNIEGMSLGVFVQGNFAYVCGTNENGGGTFSVVDISDPTYPITIGNIFTDNMNAGLIVRDSLAYICSHPCKLTIMNISNPFSPELITNFDLAEELTVNIQISGSMVYITGYRKGVYIVDISEPENPVLISTYTPPGWDPFNNHVEDVAILNGMLYLSCDSKIWIIDVFDPSFPVSLGYYSNPPEFSSRSVSIFGSMVYSAGWSYGLSTIDVSDPSLPVETSRYDVSTWCSDVSVSGDYAYVSNTNDGIKIIDISNIYNPSEVAACTRYSYNSFIKDSVLYSSGAWGNPPFTLNISNPLNPVEIATYPDYDFNNMQVIDNLLYATTAGEVFYIFDVTDPANPSIISSYIIIDGITNGLKVVDIGSDRYAFVAAMGVGAVVIDVTDPANPTVVTSIPCNSAYDVDISGNFLYISEYGNFPTVAGGMTVVDITEPTSPLVMGSYSLPNPQNFSFDIAVSEKYVYLSACYMGLRVIDVSDPSLPIEVGYYYPGLGSGTRGITLLESGSEFPYVLAAHHFEGLWIYQYTGTVGIEENNTSFPKDDMLFQSYPNPFNSNTTISYQLKEPGKVILNIYNIQGQLVNKLVDEYREGGKHSIIWNGNDENGKTVANGTYLYKLQTDKISATKKMFLLK